MKKHVYSYKTRKKRKNPESPNHHTHTTKPPHAHSTQAEAVIAWAHYMKRDYSSLLVTVCLKKNTQLQLGVVCELISLTNTGTAWHNVQE